MSRSRRPLAALLGGLVCAVAVATVWAPASGAASGPRVAAAASSTVKVMPLGDSLTGGPGCWRAPMWVRLQASGYTNVDFVGTLPGGGCDVAVWDGDNEGHGGFQAYTIAHQSLLPGWLSSTHPDIVMMTLGTNDVWNHRTVTEILDSFTILLGQMRADNPKVKLLVAQIPPMAPNSCDYCVSLSGALDAAVPGWAASLTTATSPVAVVDLATGWVPATDTTDGVHQTAAGNQKFADRWYAALTAVLDGGSPTPTLTSTTSPTTTSPTTTTRTTSPTTSTPSTTSPTPTTRTTTTSPRPSTSTPTRTCKNPKKCTTKKTTTKKTCKNPKKCTA